MMDKFTSTKTLTERLKKGDEEAFRLIYERFWLKLYQVSFYYTRSREESEDILINIYMSVWNKKDTIEIACLESYLVKAVKNQSLKYILKQQRMREQAVNMERRALQAAGDNNSPETQLEMKELSLLIDNQLASLPEKTKRIFLLNRDKGLTYKQIAGILGVSVKTVEYHISKALSLLSRYVLILLICLLMH